MNTNLIQSLQFSPAVVHDNITLGADQNQSPPPLKIKILRQNKQKNL